MHMLRTVPWSVVVPAMLIGMVCERELVDDLVQEVQTGKAAASLAWSRAGRYDSIYRYRDKLCHNSIQYAFLNI